MDSFKRMAAAVIAAAALSLAVAIPALAHGPQTLPDAACNAGTGTAHGSLGANAAGHERIPHQHEAGAPCVHLNPTAAH
jgi:hypothetical protein